MRYIAKGYEDRFVLRLLIVLIIFMMSTLVSILDTFVFKTKLYVARQEKNACYFFRASHFCAFKTQQKGGDKIETIATPIVWVYDSISQPLYGIIIEEKSRFYYGPSIYGYYRLHPILDYEVKKGDSLLIGSGDHQYVATAIADGSLTYNSRDFYTKAVYAFSGNIADALVENDVDFIKIQHQSFTSKYKGERTREYTREKGWAHLRVDLGAELRIKKGYRMLIDQVQEMRSSQN